MPPRMIPKILPARWEPVLLHNEPDTCLPPYERLALQHLFHDLPPGRFIKKLDGTDRVTTQLQEYGGIPDTALLATFVFEEYAQ